MVRSKFLLLGAALVAALAVAPAALAEAEVPNDAGFVVLGSKTGNGAGIVRIRTDLDNDGKYESAAPAFFPYGASPIGDGVRVATGDFNGDGNDELVTSAGTGQPVEIWTLNPDGSVGGLIDSKKVFGARGVFVAAGDFNGDGVDELVTSATSGSPSVKTWHDADADTKVFDEPIESFLAYGSGFHGGVRVAVADVSGGSAGDELVTGQGPGGRQVKIWTDADADARVSDLVDNPLFDQFNAYPSSFKGGVNLAAGIIGDVGGPGAEVIVAPGAGAAQKVKIYTDSNGSGKVSDNPVFESFNPYGGSWKKGVRVGAGDTDHTGFLVEVLTAPAASSGSQKVKVFDDDGDANSFISDNPLGDSFIGGAGNAGVFPAFGRVFTGTYTATSVPQFIPDQGTINNSFTIPASAGRIRDINVSLDIAHTFDGDLDVGLTHNNTGMALFNDVGSSNEGFIIVLDDEAAASITTASNPKPDGAITGTYSPLSGLSIFDGDDASGKWTLTIIDDSGGDSGTLFGWSLHITY